MAAAHPGRGVAIVLIAISPRFWGLPPLLALAGISMTVSNTSANSLLQAMASPRQLGRTVGLFMLAIRGGIALGALLTGATVSLLGVQRALLINGIAAVVMQVALAFLWLRKSLPANEVHGS